jgi:hypothetical protein
MTPEQSDSLSQPTNSQPSRTGKPARLKAPFIIFVAMLLLIIVAGGVYVLIFQKTSYQTVATDFVTAMQRGDKTKVDSLISPQEQAQLKKYDKTTSYYTFCQRTGQLCTYYYTPEFINKAVITSQDFKSPFSGRLGKQVTYNLKGPASRNATSVTRCTSPAGNRSLTLYLVPDGKSWLIDGVTPFSSYSC